MNQVANVSGNAVAALSVGSLKGSLKKVTSTIKVQSGGEYLVLTKTGKWVSGQSKTKIDPNTKWAMNVPSLQHGWTCWERGDDADTSKGPLGEVMVSLFTDLPNEHELKDYGAPWNQQLSVEFTGVGGEDHGKKVIYKTNSKGGVSRMRELIDKIADTMTDAAPVPLIQFDHDSYVHKKWGETLTPIYNIVGWTDMMGETTSDEDGVVEDDGETQIEASAAPAVDDEDPEEKLFRELEAKRAAKLKAAEAAKAPAEAGAPVRRRTR